MPIERQMHFGVVGVIRRRHAAAEGSFGRDMNECAQEFSDRGSYAWSSASDISVLLLKVKIIDLSGLYGGWILCPLSLVPSLTLSFMWSFVNT